MNGSLIDLRPFRGSGAFTRMWIGSTLAGLGGQLTLALAVSGAADNISSIYRSTMMQASVPDSIRGRLQGIFIIVVTGGPRFGALYVGALSTLTALWFPPLLGGFIVIALVALAVRLTPRFRSYDAENPTP